MKSYPTKKLGEIVELHYGKGISKHERKPDGKYPVYGANGILDYSDKFLIDSDAVIVGRKGSAGEVTRVSGKFWPSDVTYYVLGNDKINVDYLFHLFKSLHLQQFAVGVKPGINRNRIYELQIPLPPIAEQKKIVARPEGLLGKIKGATPLRPETPEAAQHPLPAKLHRIFTQPTTPHKQHTNKLEFVRMSGKPAYVKTSADKWEEKELGEIVLLVRGPFGGSLKKDIFVETGDCVYEQGNVIDGDLKNFRYFITPEKFDQMKRFAVSAGDILMSCSGTIGRFVIVPEKFKKGIINQALLKITPSQKISSEFLKFTLENYFSSNKAHVKGMAIKNIAAVKELKKIKIPLPPVAEQKKIVARLDSLSEKIKNLREYQNSTASDFISLEQSVLHKAFSGKM